MTDAVFTTERLRAVHWREEHAEPAFAAWSDPDFVRYLGVSDPHPSLDHTRAWIARIRASYADPPDAGGFWAVERRSDGVIVGSTLLRQLPGGDGEYEIGWHVLPPHQGNGYASESGAGAAAYAFDTVGLDEVFAVVFTANAPSLAIARRIGMTHVGLTSRYYDTELELFRLTKDRRAAAGPAARRR